MLTGKVAVVTGGAGLLGRAFVRRIVEQGGTAIAADIDAGAAERVAQELAGIGPGRAVGAPVDITDVESVTALIDKMVPPGESNRQWSPAKRELFSQRELSVSTAKITALPTAFVAALSCRKEPAERYAQPATVCSQRWWSAVIA